MKEYVWEELSEFKVGKPKGKGSKNKGGRASKGSQKPSQARAYAERQAARRERPAR